MPRSFESCCIIRSELSLTPHSAKFHKEVNGVLAKTGTPWNNNINSQSWPRAIILLPIIKKAPGPSGHSTEHRINSLNWWYHINQTWLARSDKYSGCHSKTHVLQKMKDNPYKDSRAYLTSKNFKGPLKSNLPTSHILPLRKKHSTLQANLGF